MCVSEMEFPSEKLLQQSRREPTRPIHGGTLQDGRELGGGRVPGSHLEFKCEAADTATKPINLPWRSAREDPVRQRPVDSRKEPWLLPLRPDLSPTLMHRRVLHWDLSTPAPLH